MQETHCMQANDSDFFSAIGLNSSLKTFLILGNSPNHRGFKPPPLGGLFLGWGFKPLPENFAVNCQLSTVNCQLSTVNEHYLSFVLPGKSHKIQSSNSIVNSKNIS